MKLDLVLKDVQPKDLSDGGIYVVPIGVSEIDSKAFCFVKNKLTELYLSETVKTIGKGALKNCTNLKKVFFAKSLQLIGEEAFAECTSLKEVVLNSKVETIENNAFANCLSLETVNLEKCSKLFAVNPNTFKNCSNLKTVTLPRNLSIIEHNAFANCKNLGKLEVTTRTEISPNAFRGTATKIVDVIEKTK